MTIRSTLHSTWCFNYPAEIIHRLISLIHISLIGVFFFFYSWNTLFLVFFVAEFWLCHFYNAFRWLAYRFVPCSVPATISCFSRCDIVISNKIKLLGMQNRFLSILPWKGHLSVYLNALMRGRIILLVRFEVLKDVTMKINVYRVMTPWNGEEAGIPGFPRNLLHPCLYIYQFTTFQRNVARLLP